MGYGVFHMPARSVIIGLIITLGCQPTQSVADATEEVRGLVRPVSRAVLSSEIRDRIVRIGYRVGETFGKGDTLLEFDCKYYRAELKAKSALYKAENAQYKNNLRLLELNATSDIEVEVSAARAEEALAEKNKAEIQVTSCVLNAPYAGAVDSLLVNESENVAPSTELMTILSHADLEIELLVPSAWLRWIKPTALFSLRVDETGTEHKCEISRVAASVDPVSQTVLVIAKFVDAEAAAAVPVLAGMSGSARFDITP